MTDGSLTIVAISHAGLEYQLAVGKRFVNPTAPETAFRLSFCFLLEFLLIFWFLPIGLVFCFRFRFRFRFLWLKDRKYDGLELRQDATIAEFHVPTGVV